MFEYESNLKLKKLFPFYFLHFAKKSFQKEISFKMEALDEFSTSIIKSDERNKLVTGNDDIKEQMG